MRVQLARLSRANTERKPTGINEPNPNLTVTNPINFKKTNTKVMLKIPENLKVKMVKITKLRTPNTKGKYYKQQILQTEVPQKPALSEENTTHSRFMKQARKH